MSDISFRCPSCAGVLVVDEAGAGWEVDCPKCGSAVIIPAHSDVIVKPEPPVVEPPVGRHDAQAVHEPIEAPVESVPDGGSEASPRQPLPSYSMAIPKAQGASYERRSLKKAMPEPVCPDTVAEPDWINAKQYIRGFADQVFKRSLSDGECDQIAAVTFTSSLGAQLVRSVGNGAAYGDNNGTNRRLARALILCKINPAPEVLG